MTARSARTEAERSYGGELLVLLREDGDVFGALIACLQASEINRREISSFPHSLQSGIAAKERCSLNKDPKSLTEDRCLLVVLPLLPEELGPAH